MDESLENQSNNQSELEELYGRYNLYLKKTLYLRLILLSIIATVVYLVLSDQWLQVNIVSKLDNEIIEQLVEFIFFFFLLLLSL